MSEKYHLKYQLEPSSEGFSLEQIKADKAGGCDAVVFGSIVYGEDGASSTAFLGLDGRTGKPMPDIDLFKAWVCLADQLSESEELPEGYKNFAGSVFQTVRDIILTARGVPAGRITPNEESD